MNFQPYPLRMAALFVLFLLSLTTGTACAEATTEKSVQFYVAVTGNDQADASATHPVATIGHVLKLVDQYRKNNSTAPIVITIGTGVYQLDRPIIINSLHDKAPLTIKAAPQTTPQNTTKLIGGKRVKNFQRITDRNLLKRLPSNARSHVVVSDLFSQGITIKQLGQLQPIGFGRGGMPPAEIFINGKPATLARYPNDGWLTIDQLPDGNDGLSITCKSERTKRWTKATDAWLFGYWFHGWADQYLPIKKVTSKNNRIDLNVKHGYGFKTKQRFFALNLLEELDQPGEYYIDRKAGKLYLWLPKRGGIKNNEVVISLLNQPLLQINNASNVTIQGLTIEVGRAHGIAIHNSKKTTIANCNIRNVGQTGITVSQGNNVTIDRCTITNTGGGGIVLSGGDRKTLTSANHLASNNTISYFSRIRRTYTPAIRLNGVGNLAEHNLLQYSPHMAIGFGGNDHIIRYNHIHHVLLETDDAGAMYIGRDWTMRGHKIRYNLIEQSGPGYASTIPQNKRTDQYAVYEPLHKHGTNLIYLDDCASGIDMIGNVLVGGGRAFLIGGGRDNLIQNNLIIGGNIGIWIDGRGLGWASKHAKPGGGWSMYKKLKAMNYDQPPYVTRYPQLKNLVLNNPAAPVGTVAKSNVVIGAKVWKQTDGKSDPFIQFKNNINHPGPIKTSISPARLLRSVNRDQLKKINFTPIPFDKIGVQK